MANKHDIYVPSTTPGKVWKVYVHKGYDKRIYAAASHGEHSTSPDGVFDTFTTVIGEDKFYREYLSATRLTDKVEREGVAMLVELLKRNKLAPEDYEIPR